MHRWQCLLKQQSSITAHRLLTKENKLPFSANKKKFVVFVFRMQQTNRSCHFLLVPLPFVVFRNHGDGDMENGDMMTQRLGVIKTGKHGDGKLKIEAQVILLHPFTVCSSCKRKLVFAQLLMKKQTAYKRTKQTTRTCPFMVI
jgi:hypothetical protein